MHVRSGTGCAAVRSGAILTLLAALVFSGCATVQRTAVNRLGDSLADGGTVYAADDDPELIRAAAPFSLKLIESLLATSPEHRGLLLAASSGFTQYAFAFVQQEADEIEATDTAAAGVRRARARRLYLRAREYGLRGLAVTHPGFRDALRRDPTMAVRVCTPADVPQLYWTAASWAGAVAITKDRPDLIAELPQVEALMDRALQLDDAFNRGAIHTFMITYEMARQGVPGDPSARARSHFDRAIALSGGRDPSPLIALAEAVCVQQQDRAEFTRLLQAALAIDPDADPANRLVTLVMQRRARWLLTRADELFAAPAAPSS